MKLFIGLLILNLVFPFLVAFDIYEIGAWDVFAVFIFAYLGYFITGVLAGSRNMERRFVHVMYILPLIAIAFFAFAPSLNDVDIDFYVLFLIGAYLVLPISYKISISSSQESGGIN